MLLNLNDSASIINWWKVWPARHDEYLAALLATRPQFARAIREARRQIASSVQLQELLAASTKEARDQSLRQAEREIPMSSIELRWQELSMAA